MSDSSLFRKECLENQSVVSNGHVLIINPLSHLCLVILVCVVLAALILFFVFGSYTRSETVSGFLQPSDGLSRISGVQSGTVEELYVKEGEVVQAGTSLLRIRTGRLLVDGSLEGQLQEQLDLAIVSLQVQIDQSRTLAEVEKRKLAQLQKDLQQQRKHLVEQLTTQKKYVAVLEQELSVLENLLARKHISKSDYNGKLSILLTAQLELQGLKKEKAALEARYSEVKSEYQKIDLDSESRVAALMQSVSEMRQRLIESQSRSSYVLTAPVSGTVSSLLVRKGAWVDSGRQLLTVLPINSELQAELYVPTRAIGFTKIGQTVQVRYSAFPYQKFGFYKGHVTEVSRTIIAPNDIPAPAQLNEPVYRVTVSLSRQAIKAYGEDYPLQSGMQLTADMMGEKRSIFEWLLEPLYSLSGRAFFSS